MKKTPNLNLPIYNEPLTDVFNLEDWNNANNSLDGAYKEIIDFKNNIPFVNADAEIVEARKGKQNLGEKISELDSLLEQKMNKDGIVTLANLGQDVKESMTGGSVAVVGEDMINLDNLGYDFKTYYSKNLLNKNMLKKGKVLYGIDNADKNCLTGTHLWENTTTNVISYIPVNNKTYDIVYKYNDTFSLNKTRLVIIGYNSSGTPVARLDTSENTGKIFGNSSISYICIQLPSDFNFDNLYVVETFEGIDYSKVADVYLKLAFKEDLSEVRSKLYRKKIAVIGDSITGTDYTTPTWWQMIAEETGCTITNYGISGTTVAYNADRETTYGKCFVNRVADMESDFDIIFVMGGTNDRGRTKLGEWRDTDISTMYGALNTLIKSLKDKFPNAVILFATPIQEKTSWDNNYKFIPSQSFFTDVQATTIIPSVQYISEAIKIKCRQYGVKCLNLFDESGICGYSVSDFRTDDTLHPSSIGQLKLKRSIQNYLETSI